MRLLVILALLVSALVMASPVTAAPTGAMSADCHSMGGKADDHGGQNRDGDARLPVSHMCSGCAFLAISPLPVIRRILPAIPASAFAPRSFAGADIAPVPPPPRTA